MTLLVCGEWLWILFESSASSELTVQYSKELAQYLRQTTNAARARIGPHLLNGHGKRPSDLSGGRFSFLLDGRSNSIGTRGDRRDSAVPVGCPQSRFPHDQRTCREVRFDHSLTGR